MGSVFLGKMGIKLKDGKDVTVSGYIFNMYHAYSSCVIFYQPVDVVWTNFD